MADADYVGVGFAVGKVTGARAFQVTPHGLLTGLYFPQYWTPDVNTAACRKRQVGHMMYGGRSPGIVDYNSEEPDIPLGHLSSCRCGFYGFYDGSNDFNKASKPKPEFVSAVIEGWGECVIGTRGFRCTKARIIALQITPTVPAFDRVVQNYSRIPMFSTFADMVAEFPPNNSNDVMKDLPIVGNEGEETS